MAWKVELLDRRVERELDALAQDIRQRFLRIGDLIEQHGLAALREPHVKHLEGKLWEIKMNLPGSGGYRIFYCMVQKETMLLPHAYAKKSQKAPKKELETAWHRLFDAQKRGV